MSVLEYFYSFAAFAREMIIIITTLFQEDNIFGMNTSLTYENLNVRAGGMGEESVL